MLLKGYVFFPCLQLPHAVVDLYGTATSARIVNDNNDHGEV